MKDFLIIGSQALAKHLGVLENIKPKDFDIVYPESQSVPNIAVFNKKVESHPIPDDIYNQMSILSNNNGKTHYASLEVLYLLKLSHAEYDIHWHKTVSHIMLLRKYVYNELIFMDDRYQNLFNDLKDYWNIVHKDKKEMIKLNVSKEKFFNNKVERIYNHDDIHRAISYYDKPLFEKCLRTGSEVLIDKSKFEKLSFEDKIKLCREEIYVLALERIMIPNNFLGCKHEAYRTALKRLVTKMTKGWFPTWIVDNYNILYKIDVDYTELFQKRIKRKINDYV